MKRVGKSWTETLAGFLQILMALATPFLRFRRRRWGATDEEVAATYPGDDFVRDPKWTANHAISIHATPAQVWPWVVQIGQGRGGFYAYEKLENLAGCRIDNASRILEEHQNLRPGDPVRLHVDIPPLTAVIVDAPSTLVLHGNPGASDDSAPVSSSWAFLLLEQPDGTTRLLSRTRYDHADGFRARLMGGPSLLEPISFVMERKMLRVLKALVESSPR